VQYGNKPVVSITSTRDWKRLTRGRECVGGPAGGVDDRRASRRGRRWDLADSEVCRDSY